MPRTEAIPQETVTPTYERRTHAVPDEIRRIRGEVAAFAQRAGASPDVVDDVRLAVTEACTNVVIHAYERGERAPLLVRASTCDAVLCVSIRDWGCGIRTDTGTGGLGLGLPLLHALAQGVEVVEGNSGGVEVRMRFGLGGDEPTSGGDGGL